MRSAFLVIAPKPIVEGLRRDDEEGRVGRKGEEEERGGDVYCREEEATVEGTEGGEGAGRLCCCDGFVYLNCTSSGGSGVSVVLFEKLYIS